MVIGNINDKEFGIAQLTVNITRSGRGTRVIGRLADVPGSIGMSLFKYYTPTTQWLTKSLQRTGSCKGYL